MSVIAKILLIMIIPCGWCRGDVYLYSSSGEVLPYNSGRRIVDQCNRSDGGYLSQLFSGLLGAVLAVLLQRGYDILKDRKNKKAMVQALIEECKYNLSIIDEIAKGIASGASYKRVRDDVFVEMRKVAYQHGFKGAVYRLMARVSCDENLLNNQLDILQGNVLSGKMPGPVNISALAATQGVKGSLTDLLNALQGI